MTGKTHRQGGMLCAMIGFLIALSNGLLLEDVSLYLQFLIIYPFALWGSIAPDLDHHWKSAPARDTLSRAVNVILHLAKYPRKILRGKRSERIMQNSKLYKLLGILDAKHRSFQTHSDISFIIVAYLTYAILNGKFKFGSYADTIILTLILTGVSVGTFAHLLLDLFTPEGIWNSIFVLINRLRGIKKESEPGALPEHWHLVPDWHFFRTGSSWEDWFNKFLKLSTTLVFLYMLLILAGIDIPYIQII